MTEADCFLETPRCGPVQDRPLIHQRVVGQVVYHAPKNQNYQMDYY